MTTIPVTQGAPQASNFVVETALPVTGNISRTDGQTVLTSMDTLFGNLLEDRSARFVGGGTISLSSNGQTLTFSDRLDLIYNNAGTQETITSVVAASGTLPFTANGNMSYVVLTKGSSGSVTLTSNATSLPAATTYQEVFLLAIRRDDLSPATERVYLYNGLSVTANQSLPPGVPSATTFSDTSFEVYNNSDPTKLLEVSLGGSSTSTTTILATSSTANHTLTLPNATGTIAYLDTNSNSSANSFIEGYTTTATAAGTTTLTVASTKQQYFTGTTTQTVKLPVTSTLVLGQQYVITNLSTNSVTVESSGSNSIQVLTVGTTATFTVISTSLTTAAAWSLNGIVQPGVSSGLVPAHGIPPTQTIYTSGSGTYTTPSGVSWLRVRMVGGGGGGAGSGNGTGQGAGGNSTFGTSLIAANGGAAGSSTGSVAAGGTTTINTPATGINLSGSQGQGGEYALATSYGGMGGNGGASAFGGAGAGGGINTAGGAGGTNCGGGGGGGGFNTVSSADVYAGGGGGSGAFIDAIIPSPSSTYSFVVGTAGAAGSAGTNGQNGGSGSVGLIVIEEHYY